MNGGGGGRSPMWHPAAVRWSARRAGGLVPSVVPEAVQWAGVAVGVTVVMIIAGPERQSR